MIKSTGDYFRKAWRALTHLVRLTIAFVLAIIVSLDLFGLAILIDNSSKEITNSLFDNNVLVPLTVIMAGATITPKNSQWFSVVSGLSLVYCCAIYIYFYNKKQVGATNYTFFYWLKEETLESFLSTISLINKFGLMLGFMGLLFTLITIPIDYWVKNLNNKITEL